MSAPQTPREATPPALRFMTVAELREHTPPEPTWLWEGYIAAGDLVVFAGKPKVGKSTMLFAFVSALSTGADSFLGSAVRPCPVVYVSEEGAQTLLHKLPADGAELHILTRDGAWPKPPWKTLIAAAVARARQVGARLIVIDTAAYWTALAAERSKDGDTVQAVVAPAVQATREGITVMLAQHQRKVGGEDGDAVAGSNQWVGSVDSVIELERPKVDDAPVRQRLLTYIGRWPNTPAVALIDYDPATGSWAHNGHAEDRQAARAAGRRQLVLDALASGESLTRTDLEQATGAAWRDLIGTIRGLITDGLIGREGAGRKGDPYRFRNAVGDEPPQKPTAPTESLGSTALDSVVCCVATPQNQAAAAEHPDSVDATESPQHPEPPAQPDPLASMPRALQDDARPVDERHAPNDEDDRDAREHAVVDAIAAGFDATELDDPDPLPSPGAWDLTANARSARTNGRVA